MNSDWTTVINKRDKQKGNQVKRNASVKNVTTSNATTSNATTTEDTNPLSYRNMLLKIRYAIPKKEMIKEKETNEEDKVEQKQWWELSIADKKIAIAKAKEKKKLAEAYKLSRGIPSHFRPINKRDYTLTNQEEERVYKSRALDMCCTCCSSSTAISKIIKRPFTNCHRCYCCVGDDPYFDNRNLCIYVSPKLDESYIFWDANCPNKYY